jgi:hypothetical protein
MIATASAILNEIADAQSGKGGESKGRVVASG